MFLSGRARWVYSWLPELPLGHRLLLFACRREEYSFLLPCFGCMRGLTARHRGRARHPHGGQRVLAGKEEVGRSAVVVFVTRRRVSVETRGNIEWTLSDLLVWARLYRVRVREGRFDLQKTKLSGAYFWRSV